MSVAAMTLDDQRPLTMNTYENMPNYNATQESANAAASAVVCTTTSSVTTANNNNNNNSSGDAIIVDNSSNAKAVPLSAPASPTPSGSEEQLFEPASYKRMRADGILLQHGHQHQHHLQQQQQQQQQHQHQREPQREQEVVHNLLCAELLQLLPKEPNAARAFVSNVRVLAEKHGGETKTTTQVGGHDERQKAAGDLAGRTEALPASEDEAARLRQQVKELQLREALLVRRMASQEKDYRENNINGLLQNHRKPEVPSLRSLRTMLLDPAVNLMLQKSKNELQMTRSKLEQTQSELAAWQFSPSSTMGKRLVGRCRVLIEENEELGKLTSTGRVAKLEAELSMQLNFSEEVKNSQEDFDELMQDLDEDMDGMQTTIAFLQQELKAARERTQTLEAECVQLKQELKNAVQKEMDNAQQSVTTPTTTIPTAATNGSSEMNGKLAECVEVAANAKSSPSSPYNNIIQQAEPTPPVMVVPTQVSELSRPLNKRSYSEAMLTDQPINMTTPRDIPAPRTLPPKKSKLRDLNARQNSLPTVIENQPSEMQTAPIDYATTAEEPSANIAAVVTSESDVSALAPAPALVPAPIAVTPITPIAETVAPPLFPRIMTRRQSVRLQQNGSIDH